MRAGDLRDRITVQQQAKTADGRGGYTLGAWSTYNSLARIPAKVTPLTGTERLEALQVQSNADHEVLIRYQAGITADMRIVWHAYEGDRTLYIVQAPVVTGIDQGLRFMARQDAD